jgi:hypothetical protein
MIAKIPLSAFRVPQGKLAITFDLHGLPCGTAVVDADKINLFVSGFDDAMELQSRDRAGMECHVKIRQMLRSAWQDEVSQPTGLSVALALRLAVNHAFGGNDLKDGIAASLREQAKAQLTLTNDQSRKWAFAISGKPAEMTGLLASLPDGAAMSFTEARDTAEPKFH